MQDIASKQFKVLFTYSNYTSEEFIGTIKNILSKLLVTYDIELSDSNTKPEGYLELKDYAEQIDRLNIKYGFKDAVSTLDLLTAIFTSAVSTHKLVIQSYKANNSESLFEEIKEYISTLYIKEKPFFSKLCIMNGRINPDYKYMKETYSPADIESAEFSIEKISKDSKDCMRIERFNGTIFELMGKLFGMTPTILSRFKVRDDYISLKEFFTRASYATSELEIENAYKVITRLFMDKLKTYDSVYRQIGISINILQSMVDDYLSTYYIDINTYVSVYGYSKFKGINWRA